MRWPWQSKQQQTPEELVTLRKRQLRYAVLNLAVAAGLIEAKSYTNVILTGMLNDPLVLDIIKRRQHDLDLERRS
jgi:hypothetical protein